MHFSAVFRYCPSCGSAAFNTDSEKSKRCASCGFVYFINASAAVAAFIINDKNELLVCERANEPAKGMLDLPGGFVDNDETAEEALVREIKEELHGTVSDCKFIFSIPNEYEYAGLTVPTLDIFFETKLIQHETLIASDDVSACYFVPLNEINTELFGFKSIRKALEIYLGTKLIK